MLTCSQAGGRERQRLGGLGGGSALAGTQGCRQHRERVLLGMLEAGGDPLGARREERCPTCVCRDVSIPTSYRYQVF